MSEALDPKMTEQIERALARRQLDFYVPYPKQADFHRMGGVPGITDRLLIAGNQLGKCQTFQSLIEHPDGSRSTCGELYEDGRPFRVRAWNGQSVIETWAVRRPLRS